jgi:uncharacterized membrane protein YebE (DUF533 family)
MDPEQIIGQIIGGMFGGKKSRTRGGFGLPGLGGGFGSRPQGRGLLNAGTLLTVGGLIWGAIETMQQGSNAGTAPAGPVPSSTPPAGPPRGVMSGGLPDTPPPPLPPLPGAPAASAPPPDVTVPASLVPLVQLAVSAARADGELSDGEIAVIRSRAAQLGAAGLVDAEIQARRPLDSITAAFTTPEQRQMAYALAYAVVHGEGEVSPGERMYLTQLSRVLALPSEDVERIERETLAG